MSDASTVPVAPDDVVLPEIPRSWAWATLSQLLESIEAGRSFKCDERPPVESEYGLVKVSAVTWGTYDEDESKTIKSLEQVNLKYLIKPGDFLFSRANTKDLVGASVIVHETDRRLLLSDKILRFEFAVDMKQWVNWFLKSGLGRKQIESLSTGNQESMRNIGQERIGRICVPIAPRNEIVRTESKIDELFSRIAEGERALERVQNLVQRYRQSVLKAAVTGELTREWRENQAKSGATIETGEALLARILKARREAWEKAELDKMKAKGIKPKDDKWKQKYKEPSPPDTAELPKLSEGWAWASVDQLSLNHDGKRIPLKASDRDRRSGLYPYYGAQGVIDDIDDFLFDGDYLLVAEDGENLRSRIKPLAFNASGKFWVNNHAHILSVAPGVHRDFLRAAINSLNISMSVTGTAQPKLTQAALCKLVVPVTSLGEQIVLVGLLEAATANAASAIAPAIRERDRASSLRQSILKAAFSGALVAQNVDDEPASALLQRIATERAHAPVKPKRSPKIRKKASK